MAIITAILLLLSTAFFNSAVTAPRPCPRSFAFFPSLYHTHARTHYLSFSFAARCSPFPHFPIPSPRAGWCTGLARVRPSGCQRVVEPPPPSRPSSPAVDQVFKAPRLIVVWMQRLSRLHADRTPDLFFSLSISLDLDPPPIFCPSNAHSHANFSDGYRFPRDARWGCNHYHRRCHRRRRAATAVAATSTTAAAIRLLLAEYECMDRRARKCADVCLRCVHALGACYVSVRDWMRGNCQWNCPQLRRRNEGRVHRLTIDCREQRVAGFESSRLFHRYSRWKIEHVEGGIGIDLQFS